MTKLVFTNGCFDILHAGHIRLLEFAKQQGDVLIVGLNSDASVRRLKGDGRPVVPEEDRAAVLKALWCVDDVEIFSYDKPLELIDRLHPGVYVKGPECRDKQDGAEFCLVRALGGEIVIPDWPVEVSTTDLLKQSAACQTKSESHACACGTRVVVRTSTTSTVSEE